MNSPHKIDGEKCKHVIDAMYARRRSSNFFSVLRGRIVQWIKKIIS